MDVRWTLFDVVCPLGNSHSFWNSKWKYCNHLRDSWQFLILWDSEEVYMFSNIIPTEIPLILDVFLVTLIKLRGHVNHFSSNRIIRKLNHAKSFTLMKKMLVAPPQKMKRNRKQIDFWNKKWIKKFIISFYLDRIRKLLNHFIVVM